MPLALIGLGRLGEAEELLAAAQRDLSAHPGSPESAVVAASLGALRLEQGRVQTAFLQATSAAAVFLDLGLPVAARWCEVLSAHALALAGVAPKATQTLGALDALGLPTDMVYEVDVLQARAWASAAGGDMGTAPQATRRRRRSWARRSETSSAPRGRSTDWPGWAGPGRSSTTWQRSPPRWTAT